MRHRRPPFEIGEAAILDNLGKYRDTEHALERAVEVQHYQEHRAVQILKDLVQHLRNTDRYETVNNALNDRSWMAAVKYVDNNEQGT
jgi:hypothetical protein